jgi:hypothetical protein
MYEAVDADDQWPAWLEDYAPEDNALPSLAGYAEDADANSALHDELTEATVLATATDDPLIFRRAERVRAKKAGAWVKQTGTIANIVKALVTASPAERYLYKVFQEQADACWDGRFGTSEVPLVKLTQPCKSPAVAVLDEYARQDVFAIMSFTA